MCEPPAQPLPLGAAAVEHLHNLLHVAVRLADTADDDADLQKVSARTPRPTGSLMWSRASFSTRGLIVAENIAT
jgi:hypothetical protein